MLLVADTVGQALGASLEARRRADLADSLASEMRKQTESIVSHSSSECTRLVKEAQGVAKMTLRCLPGRRHPSRKAELEAKRAALEHDKEMAQEQAVSEDRYQVYIEAMSLHTLNHHVTGPWHSSHLHKPEYYAIVSVGDQEEARKQDDDELYHDLKFELRHQPSEYALTDLEHKQDTIVLKELKKIELEHEHAAEVEVEDKRPKTPHGPGHVYHHETVTATTIPAEFGVVDESLCLENEMVVSFYRTYPVHPHGHHAADADADAAYDAASGGEATARDTVGDAVPHKPDEFLGEARTTLRRLMARDDYDFDEQEYEIHIQPPPMSPEQAKAAAKGGGWFKKGKGKKSGDATDELESEGEPPVAILNIKVGAEKEIEPPSDKMLRLFNISATGMPETEVGATLFGAVQDPYVKVILGDVSAETEYLDGGGTDCDWGEEELELRVSDKRLRKRQMRIEVWNENQPAADTLIGEGMLDVRDLSYINVTDDTATITPVKHTIELARPGQAPQGTCTFELALEPAPAEAVEPNLEELPDDFLIRFSDLSAYDMPETEVGAKLLGAKQDPFLKVKLAGRSAKSWDCDGAGTACEWEGDELELALPEYAVRWKYLEVEVWNENAPAPDTLIGKTKMRIRDLLKPSALDHDGHTLAGAELKRELPLARKGKGQQGFVKLTSTCERMPTLKEKTRMSKNKFQIRLSEMR